MHDGAELYKQDAQGRRFYSRIDPVIIVLITDSDDRVLLINNLEWPELLRSPVSGFVESGESLEQVARRGIREEVGLTIDRLEYVDSAPWPLHDQLTAGFRAYVDNPGEIVMDPGEFRVAQWFTREELLSEVKNGIAKLPSASSMGRQLVDRWLEG